MTERQKIILAIVSALAVVGLLVALLLPSRNVNKNLDFFIQDSNANSQLEVNEPLKFTINDSAAVVDKRVLWKMGNGDSIFGSLTLVMPTNRQESTSLHYRLMVRLSQKRLLIL